MSRGRGFGGSIRSASAAAIDYFGDRSHGNGKTGKVPAAWRSHNSLLSVYSLSSWTFTATGIYYLVLVHLYPHRRWACDYTEALLWIWSGMASYVCDAVDLGRHSWSHPIDRFSACVSVALVCIKHCVCSMLGRFSLGTILIYPLGLGAALCCFHNSCNAVKKRDMNGYFFWHAWWHFACSLVGLGYYRLIYSDSV
jgi:hypothetical protein